MQDFFRHILPTACPGESFSGFADGRFATAREFSYKILIKLLDMKAMIRTYFRTPDELIITVFGEST